MVTIREEQIYAAEELVVLYEASSSTFLQSVKTFAENNTVLSTFYSYDSRLAPCDKQRGSLAVQHLKKESTTPYLVSLSLTLSIRFLIR